MNKDIGEKRDKKRKKKRKKKPYKEKTKQNIKWVGTRDWSLLYSAINPMLHNVYYVYTVDVTTAALI